MMAVIPQTLIAWLLSLAITAASALTLAVQPAQQQLQPGTPQPEARQAGSPITGSLTWPFREDPLVRRGLIMATLEATDIKPAELYQSLKDGKSLADIAQEAEKTDREVLEVFDSWIQNLMDKAVESGRLPASLAESRRSWYQQAGRMMVDQPGLRPAYPGLHQLHVVLITAAVRTSGLERSQIREQLKACRTLDDTLAESGHSGQEAADNTLVWLDVLMARLVESGKLGEAQKLDWHTSLQAALEKMVVTPGLHVAGKECAPENMVH